MTQSISFEHEASRVGTHVPVFFKCADLSGAIKLLYCRTNGKKSTKKRENAARIKALFHMPLADNRDFCINGRKPGTLPGFRH